MIFDVAFGLGLGSSMLLSSCQFKIACIANRPAIDTEDDHNAASSGPSIQQSLIHNKSTDVRKIENILLWHPRLSRELYIKPNYNTRIMNKIKDKVSDPRCCHDPCSWPSFEARNAN